MAHIHRASDRDRKHAAVKRSGEPERRSVSHTSENRERSRERGGQPDYRQADRDNDLYERQSI
jgi:hypothetical protein